MILSIAAYLAAGQLLQLILDRQVRRMATRWTVGMFLLCILLWPVVMLIGLLGLTRINRVD